MLSRNRSMTVTLLGPAGAGKSTLLGALRYRDDPGAGEAEIAAAQKALGLRFSPAQALAYLVDKSQDERIRSPGDPRTTSKRIHIRRTALTDESGATLVDIVDTPGGHSFGRQDRLTGIGYADTVVLVFEAFRGASIDNDKMVETMVPLLTCCAVRPKKRVIVAVTKLDLPRDPQRAFEATVGWLKAAVPDPSRFCFVPLSVDVLRRATRNACTGDAGFDWFSGPTLDKTILEERSTLASDVADRPLLMSVEAKRERPGIGEILFGKVLAGAVSPGDHIDLLPTESRSGEFGRSKVRVRSLERSGDGVSPVRLSEGELGGFVPVFDGRRPLSLPKTVIALACGAEASIGHMIRIEASAAKPIWLNPLQHAELLWLGRYHPCKVFDLEVDGSRLYLTLVLRGGSPIAVPREPGRRKRLLLPQAQISSDWSTTDFLSAEITTVTNVRGLCVNAVDLVDNFEELTRVTGAAVIAPFTFAADASGLDKIVQRIVNFTTRSGQASLQWPLFQLVGE
jgi:translation elongation factor EF-1alpha